MPAGTTRCGRSCSPTGTTFCAGADLRSASAGSRRHSLVDILTTILDSPKPVIGRIDGHCMGGGAFREKRPARWVPGDGSGS